MPFREDHEYSFEVLFQRPMLPIFPGEGLSPLQASGGSNRTPWVPRFLFITCGLRDSLKERSQQCHFNAVPNARKVPLLQPEHFGAVQIVKRRLPRKLWLLCEPPPTPKATDKGFSCATLCD